MRSNKLMIHFNLFSRKKKKKKNLDGLRKIILRNFHKNVNILKHAGTFISSSPFHFHSVSGPQAKVVVVSVAKEWPSLQDIIHSVLPEAFRQDFCPLRGVFNSGHSVKLKQ